MLIQNWNEGLAFAANSSMQDVFACLNMYFTFEQSILEQICFVTWKQQ